MGSFLDMLILLASVFTLTVNHKADAQNLNTTSAAKLLHGPNTTPTPPFTHEERALNKTPIHYGISVYGTKRYRKNISAFPIHLSHSSQIYLEVRYTGSSTKKILLPETCHVSPSKDPAYSPRHLLMFGYCPVEDSLRYESSTFSATRFSFKISQFFGVNEQFLYLHCGVTVCERQEKPNFHVFNCNTQAEYCPLQQDMQLETGPFVVWPVGYKDDQELVTSGPIKDQMKPTWQVSSTAKENKRNYSLDLQSAFVLSVGTFLLGLLTFALILMVRRGRKDHIRARKARNSVNRPEEV